MGTSGEEELTLCLCTGGWLGMALGLSRQTRPPNAGLDDPDTEPLMPLTVLLPEGEGHRKHPPKHMMIPTADGGQRKFALPPALTQHSSKPDAGLGDAHASPLTVVVAPVNPRNMIRFDDNTLEKPRMALFEHVDGCRMCQGLYQHFLLPNGKMGHYYDIGSTLIDEVRSPAAPLPWCSRGHPSDCLSA